MGEVMRMHEERCGDLTVACNGLDGLFGCLFSLPRAQSGPLACCSLLAGIGLQLLMRTLINAVNAGHGGKWAHAKGYIRRLIREILKKVMRKQKWTRGSTTHVPTTIKEYAVILKKEKSFFALPHAREFGSARNMDDSWRMK